MARSTESGLTPDTRVFISYFLDPVWPIPNSPDRYSRDTAQRERVNAEQRRIAELVEFLHAHGVVCIVDWMVEDDPPESWNDWLEEQLVESDFVLMLFNPAYRHFLKRGGPVCLFVALAVYLFFYPEIAPR